MAKKISKRSRAARRGELTDADTPIIQTSAKETHENDGVRKSIIRTQIKNENLLNKKIEASKIRKQNQDQQKKKKSSSLKNKIDRSDKLQDVLASKIDASIARAKYVQNARKSNWDKTNASIEIRNHMIEDAVKKELTEAEIEKMEEDEYVRKFYEGDDVDIEENEDEEEEKKTLDNNKFALLDEVEA
ncbi:ECM1 [Candida metapsilosis]|uniref:ECM1 n=1 Tax=Candida metapsilosis TaxID=273372 RepID=A0A8H7ZAU9_9ASCO|nr:ECM1 [Candida metapsilosis]